MAGITAQDRSQMLRINKWLGLNEAQDGDTNLKLGELSVMENMRITREGHLQKRPGSKTQIDLSEVFAAYTGEKAEDPKPCGAWYGTVAGAECLVVAYGGVIFHVTPGSWTAEAIGSMTQADTSFFPFSGKLYFLNGHEYKVWDGETFEDVEGYVPITVTAATPAGGGTTLEQVNKLTGLRKVRYSPDGTSKTFQLPEKEIDEVTLIESMSDSVTIPSYTVDNTAGTVTFSSVITAGTNTVEITYRKGTGDREAITGMQFAIAYNGTTDNRVFLYGDGSNKALYSGLENSGAATAEYFPDMNEMSVGDKNTPITAMVRHFSRLLVFKNNSAWSVQYGSIDLYDGSSIAAFYVTPVNDILGCDAPGMAVNVENNPVTLCSGSIYQWKSTNTSGNITRDERSAHRVSDRVEVSVGGFDFKTTRVFNYIYDHEMYFLCGGTALVWNYGNDTWYRYLLFPADYLVNVENTLYSLHGSKLKEFSRAYLNDDGEAISILAETGSMSLDKDWLRKFSGIIFISLRPEVAARVNVTIETDRRSDYITRLVGSALSGFDHVSFEHWSFITNRKPQQRRARIRANRAVYYKLIFSEDSASSTCTILSTDVKFVYCGQVK